MAFHLVQLYVDHGFNGIFDEHLTYTNIRSIQAMRWHVEVMTTMDEGMKGILILSKYGIDSAQRKMMLV